MRKKEKKKNPAILDMKQGLDPMKHELASMKQGFVPSNKTIFLGAPNTPTCITLAGLG